MFTTSTFAIVFFLGAVSYQLSAVSPSLVEAILFSSRNQQTES
jgi:hypothetical protein